MAGLDLEQFTSQLDAATQAHLEWSRRILRFAVLRTAPGNDVLAADAHRRCQFGRWFVEHREDFERLDADRTGAIEVEHQRMHDAIRSICTSLQEGERGQAADLDRFETTQHQLIEHLAHFKTLAVSQSSQVDALTGLPLRHRMEQDFELLTKLIRRRGSVQMVMMLDVDHFKSINDRYGHGGGDIVLQHLAAALKRIIRADDLVYRYGGEEFLLLMVVPAAQNAEHLAAQRVLEAVRAMSISLDDGSIVRPTATIGIAMAAEEESLSSVIQRADAALYRGKASGRNCYVIA